MDRPFPAYTGDEPYIFVSYSHRDSSAVYPELTWLRESGINIWYDEGIEAGTEWREELAKAIEGAKLLIYFVTSDSVQSENCRKEVNFAVEESIPIVAIHLEAVKLPSGLKLTLSDRQAIFKHEIPNDEYQQKLQSRISSYLGQEIIRPLKKQESKSTAILVGMAVVVLVIGLFIFNQQTVKQPVETATGQATEAIPSEQPTSNSTETVDLAAMRSIAVLPFANMSTNEEIGFFAAGLSEDILDNLAKVDDLMIASRSASFQFSGRGQDPIKIGSSLNVGYMLAGSVRQQEDNLRVTSQLIRTEDGFHVWSKTYERVLGDVFETQSSIAENIANVVEYELGFDILKNHGWKQLSSFKDVDPIAVQHYLDADYLRFKMEVGDGGDWKIIEGLLKKSVEVDPGFLEGYLFLAYIYIGEHGDFEYEEASFAAHNVIDKALSLNPDSLSVLSQLEQLYVTLDLDFKNGEAVVKQISDKKPGFFSTSSLHIALNEGRVREVIRLNNIEINALTDPANRGSGLSNAAWIFYLVGDFNKSLEINTKALNLLSGEGKMYSLINHSLTLSMLGRTQEARFLAEQAWNRGGLSYPKLFPWIFAQTGQQDRAQQILNSLSR